MATWNGPSEILHHTAGDVGLVLLQWRRTLSSTRCGVSGRSAMYVVKLAANDVAQVHQRLLRYIDCPADGLARNCCTLVPKRNIRCKKYSL